MSGNRTRATYSLLYPAYELIARNPRKKGAREIGIHQISVSLDYPDARHDDFRRVPGLFERMSRVIPEITAMGHGDLSLNVCVTAWNHRDLPSLVTLAREWRTQVNLSCYTSLRMGDTRGIPVNGQLDEVAAVFDRLIEMRREDWPLYTSPRVLAEYLRFFKQRRMPGCQAGRRFLVINPDGALIPCAMVWARYDSQLAMLEDFTRHNACEMCFISTRANTEKTLRDMLSDNRELLLRALPFRAKLT